MSGCQLLNSGDDRKHFITKTHMHYNIKVNRIPSRAESTDNNRTCAPTSRRTDYTESSRGPHTAQMIQGDSGATLVEGCGPGTPWPGTTRPQCLTEFYGFLRKKGMNPGPNVAN